MPAFRACTSRSESFGSAGGVALTRFSPLRLSSRSVSCARGALSSKENTCEAFAIRSASGTSALVEKHYKEHRLLDFYAAALEVTSNRLSRTARNVISESALQMLCTTEGCWRRGDYSPTPRCRLQASRTNSGTPIRRTSADSLPAGWGRRLLNTARTSPRAYAARGRRQNAAGA
jgi:hypothetical protein